MKYAFVHKNFRGLAFEQKVIFFAQALTIFSCFMPWLSTSIIGESDNFNAFVGPTFLMGWTVFLLAFSVCFLFSDRLFDRHKIKLPFSENYFFGAVGVQQILILILTWSVLATSGCGFESEVRFGIFMALMAQVTGLLATFLNFQQEKQKEAKSFFQHPRVSTDDQDRLL